jgi:hypothetical protein
LPLAAAATETAIDLLPTSTANPTHVTVNLTFRGVTFDPSDLYDALNAQWGTVKSNSDAVGPGRSATGPFDFEITT